MIRSSMPPKLSTRFNSHTSNTSNTSATTSSTLSTQYLPSPREAEEEQTSERLSTATTEAGVGRRRFRLTKHPAEATYEFVVDGNDNGCFSPIDSDFSRLGPKAASIAAASATGYIAESTPRLRPNRPFIFLYAGLSPQNSRVVASARRPSPVLQDFQIGLGDPRAVARVVSEVPGITHKHHHHHHHHHHPDNVHNDIVWEDFEAVGHGEASPWSMTHAEGKRGTYAWKRTRTHVVDGMSAARLGRSGMKLVDPRKPADAPLAIFTRQGSGASAGGILQINPHDEGPGFEEMVVMTLVCLSERDTDRNRMPMGPGFDGDEDAR